VLQITPNATLQGPAINVIITGQGFVDGLSAWLGNDNSTNPINVLAVSSTVITGTLLPDIPGVYGLRVTNPDSANDTLSPAFTIYPLPHPAQTFGSADAYISTFGPGAPITEGDRDHVQVIYFELPDSAPGDVYLRIFDADTFGEHDRAIGAFDSVMTYTLRGGDGAYVPALDDDSDAVNGGTVIAQAVVGADVGLNNDWLTLPVSLAQGQQIGSKRIFKLVVQGASGNDGNGYLAVFSTDQNDSLAVTGARVFAFEWCVVLPDAGDEVSLYPYVPSGTADVYQSNFNFGNAADDDISITTPTNTFPDVLQSQDDAVVVTEGLPAFAPQWNATWSARYVTGAAPLYNSFGLWFIGNSGPPLAVFTAPTLYAPP
jgi:hypothetical protein